MEKQSLAGSRTTDRRQGTQPSLPGKTLLSCCKRVARAEKKGDEAGHRGSAIRTWMACRRRRGAPSEKTLDPYSGQLDQASEIGKDGAAGHDRASGSHLVAAVGHPHPEVAGVGHRIILRHGDAQVPARNRRRTSRESASGRDFRADVRSKPFRRWNECDVSRAKHEATTEEHRVRSRSTDRSNRGRTRTEILKAVEARRNAIDAEAQLHRFLQQRR